MTRIELKDDDIFIGTTQYYENQNPLGEEKYFVSTKESPIKSQAEQLKKQILEDYEFRESQKHLGYESVYVSFQQLKELKDKAEKWDKITKDEIIEFIDNGWTMRSKYNGQNLNKFSELESQVKELKESKQLAVDDMQGVWRQYDRIKDELQKYKQLAENVKSDDFQKTLKWMLKSLEDRNPERDSHSFDNSIKILKQLIEGLEK